MKKALIISTIVLFIALLAAAWWYLLLNGRPDNLADVSFPNPFGNTEEQPTVFEPTPVPTAPATTTPGTPDALRMIARGPVAGAVFIERDEQTYIRYATRGTGHLFEINPQTGDEVRISGTTIPRTTEAVWSPQGTRVVLITETGTGAERVFVGSLVRTDDGEEVLESIEIDPSASNVTFAEGGESLFYTTHNSEGSIGYAHDLRTNEREIVFSTPVRSITVGTWEPELITYTTPTSELPGYAYTGASFTRLFGGQYGLVITAGDSSRIVSFIEDDVFMSRAQTPSGTSLAIPVLPEKCAVDSFTEQIFWCGAPLEVLSDSFPDRWYQGAVSLNDLIWQLDTRTGAATLLSVPSDDVGEPIDVIDMQVSSDGSMLLFINKRDGTLWIQETT